MPKCPLLILVDCYNRYAAMSIINAVQLVVLVLEGDTQRNGFISFLRGFGQGWERLMSSCILHLCTILFAFGWFGFVFVNAPLKH